MMVYLVIVVLIVASALFSGLTLGLMSLGVYELKRKKELGDMRAARVYNIRRRGNLLLTTLLLGNVLVNTILSVFFGSIASGVIATIFATILIVIFGEIMPQAIISRHALKFGAMSSSFVRVLLWLFFPICFPIAWILDKLLGEELRSVYSKQELIKVIEEHEDSPHSDIDADEERVLKGALLFSGRRVRDSMTPLSVVQLVGSHENMTRVRLKELYNTGFSRFPVYETDKNNIVGIFYLRDMVLYDDGSLVADVMFADILRVRDTDLLDAVLNKIIKKRRHLCAVYDAKNIFQGVISLEDILEEIVGREIVDEDDVIVDTRKEAGLFSQ